MLCQSCRAKLDPDAVFCEECGAIVHQTKQVKRGATNPVARVAVLALIAGAAGAIAWLVGTEVANPQSEFLGTWELIIPGDELFVLRIERANAAVLQQKHGGANGPAAPIGQVKQEGHELVLVIKDEQPWHGGTLRVRRIDNRLEGNWYPESEGANIPVRAALRGTTTDALPGGQTAESQHAAAIKAIRVIHKAQVQYQSQYGKYAGSLTELGPPVSGAPHSAAADLIPGGLAMGEERGYRFRVTAMQGGYAINADPVAYGITGARSFYSDQSMVIRQNGGPQPATGVSEIVQDTKERQ